MAWNQSTGEAAKPQPKKPSALRGVIAGIVCAGLAAAVALFVLSGKDEKPKAKVEKDAGLIKEVKPQIVRETADSKRTDGVISNRLVQQASETDGSVAKTNAVPSDPMKAPLKLTKADYDRYRKRDKTSIFPHRSENAIANLLRHEPGAMFFGARNNHGMTEDFLKSCTVPIIVSKDDDEWTKALKRDVIEVKKELKPRLDAGEKLEDILKQTQDEYRKLGLVKHMIEKEVREAAFQDRNGTADSLQRVKETADAMLASRGLSPLKFNPIIERRIKSLKQGKEKK